jgi:hypothetical protein
MAKELSEIRFEICFFPSPDGVGLLLTQSPLARNSVYAVSVCFYIVLFLSDQSFL